MACGAAVSITRAAITSERLLGLLTPEVAQAVLTAVLADQRLRGEVYISGNAAYFNGYLDAISIEGGRVTVTSSNYRRRDELAAAVEAGLKAVTGRLLAAKLAGALQRATGTRPTVQGVKAEEGGKVRGYTLLTAKF